MRFPKIYVMYSSQSISRTLTKQYQMKFLRAHLVTPTWSALYLITYAVVLDLKQVKGKMQCHVNEQVKHINLVSNKLRRVKFPPGRDTTFQALALCQRKMLHKKHLKNKPFYSCLLSCLVFEWKWGWRLHCFDRNLSAFLVLMMLFSC